MKWFSRAEKRQGDGGFTELRAIEALATVVRTFGEQSFDTDAMRAAALAEACTRWSEALLADAEDTGAYRRLEAFFEKHRAAEVTFVSGLREAMESVVTDMVMGFRSALAEEADDEESVSAHMEDLRQAAQSGDIKELRSRAFEAVQAVEVSAQQRRERNKTRMKTLQGQVVEMQSALEVAVSDAMTDGLTQLFNRRTFDDRIAKYVRVDAMAGRDSCLLLLDIDHFKSVNDTYGHRAGDAVLQAVADALTRTCMRQSDLVARYGGEEFVVVLRGTDLKGGKVVANRLLEAVRSLKVHYGGQLIEVTTSIGLAELVGRDKPGTWVSRADAALYQAKDDGRDRCVVAPRPRPGQSLSAPVAH